MTWKLASALTLGKHMVSWLKVQLVSKWRFTISGSETCLKYSHKCWYHLHKNNYLP